VVAKSALDNVPDVKILDAASSASASPPTNQRAGGQPNSRAPPLDINGAALNEQQELERVYFSTSGIPNIGNGIFAKYDFEPNDLIIEFLGKRYDDWTQTYSNCKYAVEITTKENKFAYVDGWGIGGAAKMANDALGAIRVPGLANNCSFKVENERVFLMATQAIPKDTEVFVAYGPDYWYMTEEEYYAVPDSSEIVTVQTKRDLSGLEALPAQSQLPDAALPAAPSSAPQQGQQ